MTVILSVVGSSLSLLGKREKRTKAASWDLITISAVLPGTGAIHQNFARKKVGDIEKRAKHERHGACSEMNASPFLRPRVLSLFRLQG